MKNQKKKSILTQISTLPSLDSLKWAGQQRSILSSMLLWGLWLCRVFSLLQICKLIFRKTAMFLKKGSRDPNAKRINVPPVFCEIYFILWFVFALTAYFLRTDSVAVSVLSYYFLFESIVWVLYYTIFRRFYEENYSIYHELEYLTVLVLLIPTQALVLANVYETSFLDMVSGLLGATTDASPYAVKILGAMFAAIVISMIISSFPTERVKKKVEKPQMHVIGCGDVVQKRLYPALIASGCAPKDVFVYDLGRKDVLVDYCAYYEDRGELLKKLDSRFDKHDVVWVETPTASHVSYLKEMLDSMASLIVMEKPITVDKAELDFVRALVQNEDYRSKIFFLSYYILEKALPLYMISEYNPKYEEYLHIDDGYLMKNARLLLGALRTVDVTLIEGEDTRAWAFDAQSGGQLAETFIHNLLIATLFARLPQEWEDVSLSVSDSAHIALTAKSGQADVRLLMEKNAPADKVRRYAVFAFSNGEIRADFDSQEATVYFASLDKLCRVSVKEKHKGKYRILADLVKRVEKGERSYELDGLQNQLDVLDFIISVRSSGKQCDS